jgi:NADH-quinone oxidoreductase subunit G
MSAHWKTDMPTTVGLHSVQQMSAAAAGELKALIISGVEAGDFADRREVMSAVKKAFTVSFETRRSAIACEADVVFPVAVLEETSGTFLNWEHRRAEVNRVVKPTSTSLTEIRILSALADALGTPLGFRTSEGALESFDEIPVSTTARPSITSVKPAKYAKPKKNEALVYSWRELLDDSRCLDGATRLRASARPPVVRMSAETARSAGLVDGSVVEVDGPHASFIMPVVIEPTMVPGVVWLPTHAPHQGLTDMGVGLGSVVSLTPVKGGKK